MKNLLTTMMTLAVAGMTMGLTAMPGAEIKVATQLGDTPTVQLGVVAQRYPWNGTIDVGYRASGLPAAGTNAVVTVTVSGKAYAQDVTLANGTNTVAFTSLPANVKAKDAKVTLAIGE